MKTLVIASGYFNPVHIGHIRILEESKKLGDELLVIVNNDKQQLLKKGKIIMEEAERCEIVKCIKYVDEVILSIDVDLTIVKTLEKVAQEKAGYRIVFANGGDRVSHKLVPETTVCEEYGIEMRFDVGGTIKLNSSTIINKLRHME